MGVLLHFFLLRYGGQGKQCLSFAGIYLDRIGAWDPSRSSVVKNGDPQMVPSFFADRALCGVSDLVFFEDRSLGRVIQS